MTTKRRPLNMLVLSSVISMLNGCANPTHLAFHQTTVLGVDVATSMETSTVKATVGYDRQTAAIIPASEIEEGNTTKAENQAMSVVGLTKITVPWFGHQTITENFATGQAAQNVAKTPEAIADLMKSDTNSRGVSP